MERNSRTYESEVRRMRPEPRRAGAPESAGLWIGAFLLALAGCSTVGQESSPATTTSRSAAIGRDSEASVRFDWLTRKRAEHVETERRLHCAAAVARSAALDTAPQLEKCARSVSERLDMIDAEQARMEAAANTGDDAVFDLAFAIAKSYSNELDTLSEECPGTCEAHGTPVSLPE